MHEKSLFLFKVSVIALKRKKKKEEEKSLPPCHTQERSQVTKLPVLLVLELVTANLMRWYMKTGKNKLISSYLKVPIQGYLPQRNGGGKRLVKEIPHTSTCYIRKDI